MKSLIALLLLQLLVLPPLFADDSLGAQIYQQCKNCHGVDAMGGKEGEYPRIAGLPKYYLETQINNFKQGKRVNKPMLPVFKNWRFDADAIAAVADYINGMPLDRSRVPTYEPTAETLSLFESTEQFAEVGEEIFQDCIQCHGEDAMGKPDKESPPLVDQYPVYLRKQIGDFATGRRTHENAESFFGELAADEVEALLGYIDSLGGDE
jgi:cytochrome c553